MTSHDLHLEIDPNHSREFGPCKCCGKMTRRVWGYIYELETAVAAYYVEWTPNHPLNQANFDFIYGQWGEGTTATDRQAIAVAYRYLDSGPSFMVTDAATRPVGANPLVSSALTRNAVLGGEARSITFAMCDAVYLNDPRLEELRSPQDQPSPAVQS